MCDQFSISVVMPVRNGERFIVDALRSIQEQSVQVSQILVINDGSQDETCQLVRDVVAKDKRVRLLDGPCKGPGPARNVGLRQATGNVIAFLDCDDLWPAGKLETQLGRLRNEPEVRMVSGFVKYFDKQIDNGLAPADDARTEELFHVHLGASIYRSDVFEEVGLFDEDFLYSEDVDLMLRIRETGIPYTIMNEITLYYRRHDNSMTSYLTQEEKRDFNRALMNSLRRRKAAGTTTPLESFSKRVGY